jgi:hypothetical protein
MDECNKDNTNESLTSSDLGHNARSLIKVHVPQRNVQP